MSKFTPNNPNGYVLRGYPDAEVRIAAFDGPGRWPVVGWYRRLDSCVWTPTSWKENGGNTDDVGDLGKQTDLIDKPAPKQVVKVWGFMWIINGHHGFSYSHSEQTTAKQRQASAEQLATRIVSEQSGIPSNRIRRGSIDSVDYDQLVRVATEIQSLALYIDECGGLSIAQIATRARRLKRTYGLDLLVVDYLQLATGTSQRSSRDRVAEVTEITTRLKALAKELNIPILALSQLSRAVEARESKRPQLTDLRDSGSIEQDADVVLFVHREEYYHALQKPPAEEQTEKLLDWLTKADVLRGKAELIIGKHRHGPVGTINLQFDASVTRFDNLVKDGHA